MSIFKIGDLISFTYPAPHQQGTRAHDRTPLLLVLHNGYRGKEDKQILVHGLNFNYLTQHEIDFLKAVLNDKFATEIGEKDPSIGLQLQKMQSIYDTLNITSPYDFYTRFVVNFIKPRHYDPYRRYVPMKMTGVRVVQKYEVLSGESTQSIFSKFANRVRYHKGKRI